MSPARSTCDALIIGGGIVGCALAESLTDVGLSVTLVERGSIGLEASWAAAGMLAPQSEMPEPGPYLDFCLTSRRLYPPWIERIRAETGIDPQYRSEGMFYAAFNEEEERTLLERAAWQKPLGLGLSILTHEEARWIEPMLSPAIRMAVHFQEDHQLDPRLMTRALAAAVIQRGGRILVDSPVTKLTIEGTRVTGVEVSGEKISAGRMIMAAGCWSPLVEGLIEPLPVYPVKGQMLLLQDRADLIGHTLHSPRVYLVPRLDGRIVIGATEEHDAGFDKTVHAGAIADLLSRASELAPSLRSSTFVDSWSGLRPGTPDRRPILGESGIDGLLFATGHFRNGVLLAPLTARLITEFILTGVADESMLPFSSARFPAASEGRALPRASSKSL